MKTNEQTNNLPSLNKLEDIFDLLDTRQEEESYEGINSLNISSLALSPQGKAQFRLSHHLLLITELFLRSAEHHLAAWQRGSLLRPSLLTFSGCQNLGQWEETQGKMTPTFGRWQWLMLTSDRTEFSSQPHGLLKSQWWGGLQKCSHASQGAGEVSGPANI